MKKHLLPLIFILFSYVTVSGQHRPWTRISHHEKNISGIRPAASTESYRLEINTLKSDLSGISAGRKHIRGRNRTTVSFPVKGGGIEDFIITEVPFLSERLAEKYPGIRSYSGTSVSNPQTRIRFSLDHYGFHGVIYDKSGTYYLNPDKEEKDIYVLAGKASYTPLDKDFECKIIDETYGPALKNTGRLKRADDGQMRIFRLALACTGEFARYHISAAGLNNGTVFQQKEAVLAAMNTIMTRVNGIYENDLSIRMQLIENNDDLIFLDPETDGMTNNNGKTLIDEIQAIIDGIAGSENYDIGHVFSTGAGGIAQLNSPCTASKAKGVTGTTAPVGDPFAVDYVAHEMGHQFGATHTFNNYCGDERSAGTAVEPGSGSTIMAYAGICPPNIQNYSDPYFHTVSIAQIRDNIISGNSTCATLQNTGNLPPVADAGADYTIPAGTAFVLTGSGSDPDGDALTYTWEQTDNQINEGYPDATASGGPVFRSYSPVTVPHRYFPRLNDILSGALANTWEVLPETDRELNFSFTVRDNNPSGGQTVRDDVRITVDGHAGPFRMTSHQEEKTLTGGTTETITWDVAETQTGTISAAFVDILLSEDGSFGNPHTIASELPNNGSATVLIPGGIETNKARIMVKPRGNIFFSVNTADLTVTSSDFSLEFEELTQKHCISQQVAYTFLYRTHNGFNAETTFSAEMPQGLQATFSPVSATSDSTEVIMEISGIEAKGPYDIHIAGTSGQQVRNVPLSLEVYDAIFPVANLSSPADGTRELRPAFGITLEWDTIDNAEQYDIQIAATPDFSDLLETASVNFPFYEPQLLENDKSYYWRVKPKNRCGEGEYSPPFSFSTLETQCKTYTSTDPVIIPENRASTVTSLLHITDEDLIAGGLSLSLDITHTWVSDLTISLTSPSGTTVQIISGICDEVQDIRAIFSDTGDHINCNNNPAIGGTVKPSGSLTDFRGESLKGTWTLTVRDAHAEDGGSINSFSITRCPAPAPDNFRIKVTDESCKDTRDGHISVNAQVNLNYQVDFRGENTAVTADFSENWEIGNLAPGTYALCFTIADNPVFIQCFDVTVAPSGDLSVYTRVNTSDNNLYLTLEGGRHYIIELNGTSITTGEKNISLPLRSGKNTVVIRTDKSCQGIYEEDIYISPDDVVIYPNPFTDTASAYIGSDISGILRLSVFSLSGKLMMSQKINTTDGHSDLGLHILPPGVYLVKISGADIHKTVKILKR